MGTQLSSLNFRETTLQSGTTVYRAVTNRTYTFQPNLSLIKEGRFNRNHQYCFYIASHLETAILEMISHYQNCIPSTIYVKELTLQSDLTLVDLIRWNYDEPSPKDDYSLEHIMINQHITCPRRCWSDWLYNSTQTIADYFRNTYYGLRYQTAVAHSLYKQGEKMFGHDPEKLLNYAIFRDPCECFGLFAVSNDVRIIETALFLDFYNKNIDDGFSRRSIRCRNGQQTVSARFGRTGTLDMFSFLYFRSFL